MIYFIQRDEGGFIKICATSCLTDRLESLFSPSEPDVKMLGICEGCFADVRELHLRFAHLRESGEWFTPHPSLLDFIRTNASPWDPESDTGRTSLVSLRGTEAFETWLDELVEHTHQGNRTLLLKNALKVFAESQGFKDLMPKR
jgi:hypothetical protein